MHAVLVPWTTSTKTSLRHPAIRTPLSHMCDAEAEPAYDIAIRVHKGAAGYGIYFTMDQAQMIKVTKLDPGSEASKAGVQVGDILHSVMDLDKKKPESDPGAEVVVGAHNYQASLQMVREMKYCQLTFKTAGFG